MKMEAVIIGEIGAYELADVDVPLPGNDEVLIRVSESIRFVQVLSGMGHEACVDFTCLNAGAILYISGIADGIQAGVQRSKAAIEGGLAIDKLQKWVVTQSKDASKSLAVFNGVRDRAISIR